VSRRLWPTISVGKKATAELEPRVVSPQQQQPAAFAPIWCDGKKQKERKTKDRRRLLSHGSLIFVMALFKIVGHPAAGA